jgi:hypothetical protein
MIEGEPAPALDGYLRRGDFSRWIGDVFGDRALANELQRREELYRQGRTEDAVTAITAAVRGRYDLTVDSDGLEPPASALQTPAALAVA